MCMAIIITRASVNCVNYIATTSRRIFMKWHNDSGTGVSVKYRVAESLLDDVFLPATSCHVCLTGWDRDGTELGHS